MITPTRDGNITAAGLTLPHIMAAYVADVSANSTWTVVTTTEVTPPPSSPGAGSFSFVIESPTGDTQICVINAAGAGNEGAPDLLNAYVGTNPDGAAQSIGDSAQPWLTASNFSGSSLANMKQALRLPAPAAMNAQFLFWEWEEAICLLIKDPLRGFTPAGFQEGEIFAPANSNMADQAIVKMDGNGGLGSIPRFGNTNAVGGENWGLGRDTTRTKQRVGVGQEVVADWRAAGTAWAAEPVTIRTVQAPTDSDMEVAGIYQPSPFEMGFVKPGQLDPTIARVSRLKYCWQIKSSNAFDKVQDINTGQDVLLAISYDGNATRLAIPIRDNFIINP